jgi:hypothetical protein
MGGNIGDIRYLGNRQIYLISSIAKPLESDIFYSLAEEIDMPVETKSEMIMNGVIGRNNLIREMNAQGYSMEEIARKCVASKRYADTVAEKIEVVRRVIGNG